jgi:hypothetical protein
MATEKVRMSVAIHGADTTARAFRQYGKEANGELRDAAVRAIAGITPALMAAMSADSAQLRLVAATVRPIRDRVPVLAVGGAKKAAPSKGRKRKRPSSGDIFFGAEFGGGGRSTTRQFRPHRGTEGYAFYPTFRRHVGDVIDAYGDALDKLARDWEH